MIFKYIGHYDVSVDNILVTLGKFSMFVTFHGRLMKIPIYRYIVTLNTMVDSKINYTQQFLESSIFIPTIDCRMTKYP